jgi:hypothetical protein
MCVCTGGFNETSRRLSTEKYDPEEDTWTEIPAMNLHESYLNAEVIDDMIFVICDHYEPKDFFPRAAYFNDKENRWFVSLLICMIVQGCTITNHYFRKALGSESFPRSNGCSAL